MSDLLQRQLRDLPAFRALLRAIEARFYAGLPVLEPVLDLGCGDGHFASAAFDTHLAAGFDPLWRPLKEARRRRAHRTLALAEGARMPFPESRFGTVVSNSVLEHVLALEPVLAETARVLRPGGWFYFCVPSPNFLPFLSIGRALDRLGLSALGEGYRRSFERLSGHRHCDGSDLWEERLAAVGLEVVRVWTYLSRRALSAVEWGHYLGVPSLACKILTGRWVLWRSRANLWLTERLTRPYYEERLSQPPEARNGARLHGAEEGAYLFIVARKPVGAEEAGRSRG